MFPRYDLEKIKFGVDEKTWERAVGIYEAGKITETEEGYFGFTARVLGTHSYDVAISEDSLIAAIVLVLWANPAMSAST